MLAVTRPWPSAASVDGAKTGPQLCMGMNSFDISDARLRFMRQIGVRSLFMWGPGAPTYSPEGRVIPRQGDTAPPQGPWKESDLRAIKERVERQGLRLSTMMLHDFRDVILGRPGRDEAIDRVRTSIQVAGRVGLPVVEYNFYALRAQGGYYRSPGRAGASYASYDYSRVENLPPLPDIGEIAAEQLWERYEHFLRAVVPVAEESGVVLAVHPNDPPAPIYRGVPQIIGNLEGLKRLVNTIPSPANGITFDTGVMGEWGHTPPDLIRWFGRREQINHVHFRNVITEQPGLKYREVFLDEGEVDMLEAMNALYEVGYDKLLYPDHVPRIEGDTDLTASWAHSVGYMQGLMRQVEESG